MNSKDPVFLSKTRLAENMHVGLWLIKDLSWMMIWKPLGIAMIIPTIAVAVFIAHRTKGHPEFLLNLAILLWICANATWMCIEFIGQGDKLYSLPFFIGGLICFLIYLLKQMRKIG